LQAIVGAIRALDKCEVRRVTWKRAREAGDLSVSGAEAMMAACAARRELPRVLRHNQLTAFVAINGLGSLKRDLTQCG
jgi:hypothetical protein